MPLKRDSRRFGYDVIIRSLTSEKQVSFHRLLSNYREENLVLLLKKQVKIKRIFSNLHNQTSSFYKFAFVQRAEFFGLYRQALQKSRR